MQWCMIDIQTDRTAVCCDTSHEWMSFIKLVFEDSWLNDAAASAASATCMPSRMCREEVL
jgi:hypothetical protein